MPKTGGKTNRAKKYRAADCTAGAVMPVISEFYNAVKTDRG